MTISDYYIFNLQPFKYSLTADFVVCLSNIRNYIVEMVLTILQKKVWKAATVVNINLLRVLSVIVLFSALRKDISWYLARVLSS